MATVEKDTFYTAANSAAAAVASIPSLSRNINCLLDDNRNVRKRALEAIRKETTSVGSCEMRLSVIREILKPLLKLFADPVEKCRELAIATVREGIASVDDPAEFLATIVPTVFQRLGQQDIVESSEEIRLQLVGLLCELIELTQKKIAPHLDELIRILQRTLVDPYPEVRKESCRCTSAIAKAIPQYFHMQSESLINPLQQTISHQHSKVRVAVIYTIGDVLQYGNGKSMDDVVSHLAQRLFDQTPAVRAAVVQVVGSWLLDLMDRYSFHHKLIPLLLSGITDEMPDIRSQADALWHDVGEKYASENEKDLKDKMDFVKSEPQHYPHSIERPNLGCRTLMYHNFSKILPGLVGDLTDWVQVTRLKSAQLLYTMLVNEEDNVTQHLEKVLGGLMRACSDEDKQVVEYVLKSAELIGYFVHPEIWCKHVLQHVRLSQNAGSLSILAAVIRGSNRSELRQHLPDILKLLCEPGICHVADTPLQLQLLACTSSIIDVSSADCLEVSLPLFSLLISVIALHRKDSTREQAIALMNKLSSALELPDRSHLFSNHIVALFDSLDKTHTTWTQHSTERFIFDALLLEAGPVVVSGVVDRVIKILLVNLHPDKDPELRLKFFSVLSRLVLSFSESPESRNRFGDFVISIMRDMILPNCVWRAGRTAGAIRTTAVACLWAVLKGNLIDKQQLLVVMEDLVTQLRSTLDDDTKSTRLITCRALTHVFSSVGRDLEQERLHIIYPELLKRLDDSSDDIRVAAAAMFTAYFGCFTRPYDVALYRAHLEEIYRGLLVHLDDPDETIQRAVLDSLKSAGDVAPDMLLKEVDAVRHKHRATVYCDELTQFIHNLPKPD